MVALAFAGSNAEAAPCRATDPPATLSEARASRWLIGDELRLSSRVDAQRRREAAAEAQLLGEEPTFRVHAAAGAYWQRVYAVPLCERPDPPKGSYDQWRIAAMAGITHVATGLEARVSLVHAIDDVNVPAPGEDEPRNVVAGYQQTLVAARVGHERWLSATVGFIGAESRYATSRAMASAHPPRRAPGLYVGAVVPALHTSAVMLVQRAEPELVSVLASDLRPTDAVPFSISLGPTYIREERRTVGMIRVRGVSASSGDDEPTFSTGKKPTSTRPRIGRATFGPLVEMSTESMGGRLRHGRLRFEGEGFEANASDDASERTAIHGGVYLEGTVFRSRAFLRHPASRGETAWGGGAHGFLGFRVRPFAVDVELGIGRNRPELLALVPSAARREEAQAGVVLRLEN